MFPFCSSIASSVKPAQLPEVYRHWLNEEVNYIITDVERDVFLRLSTNQDRDKFIDNFWKIRDTDPTAPSNVAKDEHYRRLEYANENFAPRNVGNGWRTDRGMVYITLGPPQQLARYPNTKYLRQMEVWFYQSPGPGLPIYFSVIFYRPSITEDYRLYSPYSDRPEKLIASSTAVNDEPRAVRIIKEDINSEVARLSLSLLPDEPVDEHEAYPSMESDILLSKIRNYRNLEENKRQLEQRRSLLEGVTHRVLLGEQFSAMDVLATRDGKERASIHFLFRFLHPQDFALAREQDGRPYYAITLKAELLDAGGKLIYRDVEQLRDHLTTARLAEVSGQCFGVEGRLAATPGKYQIHVELTNDVTQQSYTQTRSILVPAFHHALALSQIMFLSVENPSRDAASVLPFSFSGIKLKPIGSDNVVIKPEVPLRLVFQIWEDPGSPESLQSKKIDVSYLIGHISSTIRKQDEQVLDRGTFDVNGNLLVGKDISTDGLPQGNYRAVVKITEPETHETSAQALNFQIIGTDAFPLWSIMASTYGQSMDDPINSTRRGLCALAQQQPAAAISYLKLALGAGAEDKATYHALASAYREMGNIALAEDAEKHAGDLLSH